MKATEVFRVADHIGAIVHDTDDHTLHGVSWGSRRFYRWTLGPNGVIDEATRPQPHAQPVALRRLSGLQVRRRQRMLCTGVTEIRQSRRAPFRLGGIDLIDLRGRPSPAPGPGPAVDRRRPGHDAQPGLDRADRGRTARLLHAGRREVDALHLRRADGVAIAALTAAPVAAGRTSRDTLLSHAFARLAHQRLLERVELHVGDRHQQQRQEQAQRLAADDRDRDRRAAARRRCRGRAPSGSGRR